MSEITENMIERDAEKKSEQYFKKYKGYVESLESKSLLSKVRPISVYDIKGLGEQLDQFETYVKMCEDYGTLSQLGTIPQVAFDVITVNYGSSPAGVLASLQNIEEEKGNVYFKNIVAQTTRGSVTAGDVISSPKQLEDSPLIGYSSDEVKSDITTVAATTNYTGNIGGASVNLRPGKVRFSTDIANVYATDDGNGYILGYGVSGTIDYATAAYDITLASDPGNGKTITLTASIDWEAEGTPPSQIFKFDTKVIEAEIYALKDTLGLPQAYALRKRFGMIAEEEVANDLVSSVNTEVCNKLITRMVAASVSSQTWDKTPDSGVSYYDHKMTFKDKLADLEADILGAAGRGSINAMAAGRSASALLSTLPGFTKLSDGTSIGPHIFGTLDGITVVRVPNTSVLASNRILGTYKGPSPFVAAAVVATYMPLVVTTALPFGDNPLVNQKAAAVWTGVEVLVPNFIGTLDITSS